MRKTTRIDEAQTHLQVAYDLLKSEGLAEKFFPIAVDIGQSRWGRFFGRFGSDKGVLLEFKKTQISGEIKIVVSICRQQSLAGRIKESLAEAWNIFLNNDTSYTIHLSDEEIGKLKDMLRNL